MPGFFIYMGMRNVKYDFSSVHVIVPEPLASDIVAWGRENVTDDDIFVSQSDPTFGREDEMHVTILYGIHDDAPDKVKAVIENTGRVHVKLGKVGVFSNPHKFDVLKIEVFSEELKDLNRSLEEHVPFTNKHKHYHPHITIAYVKKGKGWKYQGLDAWKGKKFSVDHAVFSSKNGAKQNISF